MYDDIIPYINNKGEIAVLKAQSKNIKKDIPVFIIFLAFSFGLLYICTASSPRYAINPWNDANAFFTVGRAMANGATLYKDIFEQKGPLLYLIHAAASLISGTSFFGVYIMQSVSLSATAFAAYKISALYLNTCWSVFSSVLTCFITVNSGCYYYGDSAEEFCLPLLMASLYFFCAYFKNTQQNSIGKPAFFVVGFFAGCVAMIKFTLIGFWFAWAVYISLYTWIAKKDFKKAAINALVFIGGMAASIVPWLVYFAVNGGFKDFINTYFVINATAYPIERHYSFLVRLRKPLGVFSERILAAPVLSAVAVGGGILYAATNFFAEKKFFSRMSVPFVAFFGIYIIYFGLRAYDYYLIPISVFTVFTFILVSILLDKLFKKKSGVISAVSCVLVIALTVVGSNYINLSSRYAVRKGEPIIQSQAAEYIKSHNPDGVILNYGCLDCGLYLAADQIPQFKHFETQNLLYDKYPENIDEQKRYVEQHLADYVVVVPLPKTNINKIMESCPALKTDYTIVLTGKIPLHDLGIKAKKLNISFYLFELKEN